MRRLNFLTVGLATKHTEHILALRKLSKQTIKITGVCNLNKKEAQSVSRLFSSATASIDIDEALDKHPVDAAFVCLPHFAYAQVLPKLIKRNIHVLKEKPFSISVEDAVILKHQLEQSKAKFMVIAQRRYHPTYVKAKFLLNTLGIIEFVNGQYYINYPATGWRKESSLSGGGIIIDSGYHMIDITNWLFGPPELVYALTKVAHTKDEHNTEDSALINLRYQSGFYVNLSLSRLSLDKSESMSIYGSKGEMHISRSLLELKYHNGKKLVFRSEPSWNKAIHNQHKAFFEIINNNQQGVGVVDNVFDNSLVIEAAYLSSHYRYPIKFSDVLDIKISNNKQNLHKFEVQGGIY